jgi:predicted DsbA family dithiol-disulfide isomerase
VVRECLPPIIKAVKFDPATIEYELRRWSTIEELDAVLVDGSSGGEGIAFALDKIKRTPNSANSHRLVRLAHTLGRQHEAVEVLFAAYFERGLDVGQGA